MSDDASPTTREQTLERVRHLRRAGDFASAIRLMFELFAENVRDREVASELATMLADDQQLDRAERVFEHALKLSPDATYLRLNYGTFLCASGQPAEGIHTLECLREALRERSKSGDTGEDDTTLLSAYTDLALARAFIELERYDMAIDVVDDYLGHPDLWYQAHEVVADACLAADRDELSLFRQLEREQRASPLMLWIVSDSNYQQTGDALRAATTLLAARAYLLDGMLRDVYHEQDQAKVFVRWLTAGLRRLSRSNAAAAAALSGLCDLLALPEPPRLTLVGPGQPVDDSHPPPHVPAPAGESRQAALQFGSNDLPLFRGP